MLVLIYRRQSEPASDGREFRPIYGRRIRIKTERRCSREYPLSADANPASRRIMGRRNFRHTRSRVPSEGTIASFNLVAVFRLLSILQVQLHLLFSRFKTCSAGQVINGWREVSSSRLPSLGSGPQAGSVRRRSAIQEEGCSCVHSSDSLTL